MIARTSRDATTRLLQIMTHLLLRKPELETWAITHIEVGKVGEITSKLRQAVFLFSCGHPEQSTESILTVYICRFLCEALVYWAT